VEQSKTSGKSLKKEQAWFSLNQNDAGQDAVMWSVNEKGSTPPTMKNVEWGYPVIEKFFENTFTGFSFRCGKAIVDGNTLFFVYSPENGS